VFVGVTVGELVGVSVGVGVFVRVGVSVGVGVFVGVDVGVSVGVAVGVFVTVAVGVSVSVGVGMAVGVSVAVGVNVAHTVPTQVAPNTSVQSPQPPMAALLQKVPQSQHTCPLAACGNNHDSAATKTVRIRRRFACEEGPICATRRCIPRTIYSGGGGASLRAVRAGGRSTCADVFIDLK
jgi:hypothetical protein